MTYGARPAVSLPTATLLCFLTGCGASDFSVPAQPEEWTVEGGARWRALAVGETGRTGFTPVTAAWSGVSFANALSEQSLLENQMRTNGSGVAVGDVDGDQRPDLYLPSLDGPNVLYRNLGDWRFEEVAGAGGAAAAGRFSTGSTLADVDGDRDLDLILTTLGSGKTLYLNDGTGTFLESSESGLRGESGAMSTALADIDGDADMDLYVTNYKRLSALDLYSPEERAFPNTVRRTSAGYEVAPEFQDHFELVWRGNGVERVEKAEPDELYLNDGNGRFARVPFEAGAFSDADGAPFAAPLQDWGLAARFGDLDRDGDPDLYVANDLQSPDRIWINQGDGRFRAISPWSVRTTSASSMAVDFSDVDRDGDVDIFTIDMLSRSSRLRKTQDPVARVQRVLPGDVTGTQQVPRNALLANRGDGTFAEVANYAGVEASDWSWSALFVDVDLDGYEDLIIPNGHIRDLMDADTQIRLRTTRLEDWRQTLLLYEPLPLRNVAFRNLGELRFEETGEAWGIAEEADISHGAGLGDLDGDGDLDVVINRLDDPALMLRNDSDRPRVAIRLHGQAPNTSGIGATILFAADGLPAQSKEIASGGGYLSGSEALATFAMGDATEATAEVRWRSGRVSIVRIGGANRLYEIEEPLGPAPELDTATGPDRAAPIPSPWFVRDGTFRPIHDDPVFDESARQPLLPVRLSQAGPQASWGDLDDDGDPDLLMTAGSGAAPVLFRNDGATLTRITLSGPAVPVDQVGVITVPVGAGGARAVLGLSNYEAPAAEAAQVPSVVALAWAAAALGRTTIAPRVDLAAPGHAAAAGPIAMADYDGDGWLDLFIGGRAVPGRYPEPAASRLLRGAPAGQFEIDNQSAGPLSQVGLVTGALFSDLDVDGDPDLVLATDWGPIKVFRNDSGSFVDATESLGLSGFLSRWNAVTTGDLDGDGRPDIIATSWGENTEYRATPDLPLTVYFGDVDRNGSFDVVEVQSDARIGGEAPLAAFGRLGSAVPSLLDKVRSHAEYADASVTDALTGSFDSSAAITGLAHTLFLNRGETFESVRLPAETQWSPSLGLAVADANADGAEDVFLTQNFFATDQDSPRYDAGRGVWLEGDGAGGLEPVPGVVSGIALYGDQRGVAVSDIDADGRVDMVIGQNGGEAGLYLNVGTVPGLRVRLVGTPTNPLAIGASMRLMYGSQFGPRREVRAGSGTGSHDDPVQVLGRSGEPTGLEVMWPGGRTQVVGLEPSQSEVTVHAVPGGSSG